MRLQKCEREKKSISEDQDEIKYLLYFGGGDKQKKQKQKSQSKCSKTVFLLIY